jgi:hypothetical protein
MLTRTVLIAAAAGVAIAIGSASPSFAGDGTGGVDCAAGTTNPGCEVHAGTGASPTPPYPRRHLNGDGTCRAPSGTVIPCERDGGHAGPDGCYYTPADLSSATITALGGQPPRQGGWYLKVCYNDNAAMSGLGGPVWVPGAAPTADPAAVARDARSRLRLPSPVIDVNPPGDQRVNFPVWLALNPASWKPRSATASVPGVTVTATARPVRVSWSMGNGSTRTCDGPGTAWSPATDPERASPDCGYIYRHSSASAPGGTYTVVATVTWDVTWAGAGQVGTVPGLTTAGHVQTRVQESDALVS